MENQNFKEISTQTVVSTDNTEKKHTNESCIVRKTETENCIRVLEGCTEKVK